MAGTVRGNNVPNIPYRAETKIEGIGGLQNRIDLGREHTFTPKPLRCQMKTAQPRK